MYTFYLLSLSSKIANITREKEKCMETTDKQHLKAMEAILEETSVQELDDFLWEMTVACLTTDAPPFNRAAKRADLLLNYNRIKALLAAGAQIVPVAPAGHTAAAA